jgi:hypothetical protein
MKLYDVNIEEAAAESDQDRRDLARLKSVLEELLKHEDAMKVPHAVRRLVDGGVDPVVVAKTLLIGDRDGGMLYRLTSRAAALHLDEQAAELWISLAIRDIDAGAAAAMLVAGAVWLATQFKLERAMLRGFVEHAARCERRLDRKGCGAVDIVDGWHVANRAWLVDAIDHAQLPAFAPLQYDPKGGSS